MTELTIAPRTVFLDRLCQIIGHKYFPIGISKIRFAYSDLLNKLPTLSEYCENLWQQDADTVGEHTWEVPRGDEWDDWLKKYTPSYNE